MAAAKKSAAKKPAAVGIAEIVAAGANGLYTSPAVHAPLVEAGLVEINPGMTNEAGEIATRATQKGIESMNSNANNTDSASSTSSPFAIEDGISIPAASGRGRTGNSYPFDMLNVGQSFFVPNSEAKPNAAKSLASTVSSATARYAVPKSPAESKTITVAQYQLDDAGKRVKGADGKSIKIGETTESVPVMVETRKFVVRSVEGGARVWRTA